MDLALHPVSCTPLGLEVQISDNVYLGALLYMWIDFFQSFPGCVCTALSRTPSSSRVVRGHLTTRGNPGSPDSCFWLLLKEKGISKLELVVHKQICHICSCKIFLLFIWSKSENFEAKSTLRDMLQAGKGLLMEENYILAT